MTNWERERKNLGEMLRISSFDIPENIFSHLKMLIKKNKKETNLYTDKLAGHIKEEYSLPIDKFVSDYFARCTTQGPVYNTWQKKAYLTNHLPIVLESLWVNYQKKFEFNPLHNHEGFCSFIVFVKIPYNLEDEENCFSDLNPSTISHTSKLSFAGLNHMGEIFTKCVDVDKSFEGKALMFNSNQHHQVHPFYTSDDYRITISGNLKYKV